MSEHYDFHYQPTGSGAISGQQVLEQTEDAINELGDYVNDNVGGAMDVAQQALETAQTAETNAQTALDTANSFSDAIQSAQQDASTALSTAQTAQTTASNANNTAIQAQQDASNAVTTANNASGQVSTLSGTVTTLGQRVTTAEGNIGQNTSDITALTTRVGTAEGNITTLQNDVSIAQGNASSAMATAGQVKQQAFVFRYSLTVLVASSTNSNALLDNTDNLKVGDKVIDSSGVLFSITAIDTANSTFTIGTALIDLALDSDVVHKSGDETVGGVKTFTSLIKGYNSDSTQNTVSIDLRSSKVTRGNTQDGNDTFGIGFRDKTNGALMSVSCIKRAVGTTTEYHTVNTSDNSDNAISVSYSFNLNKDGTSSLQPEEDNQTSFGSSSKRWKSVYATNYYYGSNNVEFSTKFVTTDTAQTITGSKTFSSNVNVYNSDSATDTANIVLKNSKVERGSTTNIGEQNISFVDKNNNQLGNIKCITNSSGVSNMYITCNASGSDVGVRLSRTPITTYFRAYIDNDCKLGTFDVRWSDVQTYKVNSVEPSSLSLPSDRSARIDISSYFTNTGSGDTNTYTVPANGYIYMDVNDCISLYMYSQTTNKLSNYGNSICRNTIGRVIGFLPVRKNDVFSCQWYTSTTVNVAGAFFIPCQGNV